MLWMTMGSLNAAHAEQQDVLKQLGSRVEQHAVLRADFTQTKQMAALKRPLITSGKLLYSKVHGVVWQITKPYPITYILSEDKVIEVSADGYRKERSVKDIPGFAQISRIFKAMLSGDVNALNAYFESKVFENTVQAEPNQTAWQLQLTPKQTQTSRFIQEIVVTGDQFVTSIHIHEPNAASTAILFSNTEAAPTLRDAELALFRGK
ncbi:Outer membrane lipoprotein carrier protein LolA [Methylophilaceae bacterium 11]|nr:Outer membrane lipoprotein carrier protein LolA [Methylophilaceae bacterium 11]